MCSTVAAAAIAFALPATALGVVPSCTKSITLAKFDPASAIVLSEPRRTYGPPSPFKGSVERELLRLDHDQPAHGG